MREFFRRTSISESFFFQCTSFSSYMEEVMKRLRKQLPAVVMDKVNLDQTEVVERFKTRMSLLSIRNTF